MRGASVRAGRIVHGLAQTAVVWIAVVVAVLSVRSLAAMWAGICLGLLGGLVLGTWHRRRDRDDSAVGAFTGVVLWPLLIGAALIAVNVVAASGSPYE
jgi:hypothetical protein